MQEPHHDEGGDRQWEEVGKKRRRRGQHRRDQHRPCAKAIGRPASRVADEGVGNQTGREDNADQRRGTTLASEKDRKQWQKKPHPDRIQKVDRVNREQSAPALHGHREYWQSRKEGLTAFAIVGAILATEAAATRASCITVREPLAYV